MTIRERRNIANYIKTGVSEPGTSTYALMGTGYSTLDDSPTAQTISKRYVNDKSSTYSISGYDWSAPFELDQILSEEAVKFVVNIGEKELTGADAETEYITVYLDRPASTPEDTYYAKKRNVAIEVASFSNNDGFMGASGNLHGIGDPVFGKATITAGSITFEEASWEEDV